MTSVRLTLVLLTAGGVALFIAGILLLGGPQRPDARGEIGRLEVYGQQPAGPIRLSPRRENPLPRPQHVAFRFSVDGRGPRLIRIEVETAEARRIEHEQVVYAPLDKVPLDYVLRLGEATPDQLHVVSTIEAPHMSAVVTRISVRLIGPSRRFWAQ